MKTLAIAFCVLFSTAAIANETESEATHASEETHGKHALGLFLGVTREHGENLDTHRRSR